MTVTLGEIRRVSGARAAHRHAQPAPRRRPRALPMLDNVNQDGT